MSMQSPFYAASSEDQTDSGRMIIFWAIGASCNTGNLLKEEQRRAYVVLRVTIALIKGH